MRWVKEGQRNWGLMDYKDRTRDFLPYKPEAKGAQFSYLRSDKLNYLDILVVLDSQGTLFFWAFGSFLLGSLDSFQLMKPKLPPGISSISIQSVDLCSSLQRLMLITHLQTDQSPHSTVLASVNTSIFVTRGREICTMAWQFLSVKELLERTVLAIDQVKAQWNKANDFFSKIVNNFEKTLGEGGSKSSIPESLLTILVSGMVDPTLENWFVNVLKVQGLKEFQRVMDSALEGMRDLTADHLQPLAELLCFKLTELVSYSKCKEQFGALGLSTEELVGMESLSSSLLITIEKLLITTLSERTQFSHLFSWLTKVQCGIFGDVSSHTNSNFDVLLIAKLIDTHFSSNSTLPLTPFFENKPSGQLNTKFEDLYFFKTSGQCLVEMAKGLEKALERVLKGMQGEMAKLFSVEGAISVCSGIDMDRPICESFKFHFDAKDSQNKPIQTIGFKCTDGDTSILYLVSAERQGSGSGKLQAKVCAVPVPGNREFVDYCFYKGDSLLLLYKTASADCLIN
uniref:Anaphase-promoting complex subunit 4 n=1 Tax=Arcella intermedia TaxID=1963864 RepID=A0A6B2L142_9EUKA